MVSAGIQPWSFRATIEDNIHGFRDLWIAPWPVRCGCRSDELGLDEENRQGKWYFPPAAPYPLPISRPVLEIADVLADG